MALWYKDTGPWWDSTNVKPNDGISFEEEHKNSHSLWSHYKRVIELKKSHPALYRGDYRGVTNDNAQVFTFLRSLNEERIVVAVNLSGEKQRAAVTLAPELKTGSGIGLMNKEVIKISNGSFSLELPSYGMQVFKLD
jgi:alpha-amylase